MAEKDLFKVALHKIENDTNHGNPMNKADTAKMVKNYNPNESYIESSLEKAKNMVESGEAQKIADAPEYKGGE